MTNLKKILPATCVLVMLTSCSGGSSSGGGGSAPDTPAGMQIKFQSLKVIRENVFADPKCVLAITLQDRKNANYTHATLKIQAVNSSGALVAISRITVTLRDKSAKVFDRINLFQPESYPSLRRNIKNCGGIAKVTFTFKSITRI